MPLGSGGGLLEFLSIWALNCKFSANLASHKALTDMWLPWVFPAGGAYASYSVTFHEFTRENPTLIDCDVLTIRLI